MQISFLLAFVLWDERDSRIKELAATIVNEIKGSKHSGIYILLIIVKKISNNPNDLNHLNHSNILFFRLTQQYNNE